MIRRPPRSTLSSSSAASDVYKRQVSTQSTGNKTKTMSLSPKPEDLDRQQTLYMAKLSEQAERYDDMVQYMKRLVQIGVPANELTVEERNLLSVGYKNMMSVRRTAWRTIHQFMEQGGGLDNCDDKYSEHISEEVFKLIEEVCTDVVDVFVDGANKPVAGAADSDEVVVFFKKMEGDYNRYGAEITEGSDKKETFKQKAQAAYEAAQQMGKSLPSTNPIRLGLALNFSVFFYEICNKKEEASALAKEAFDTAIDHLDALGDDEYKDSTLIMQLLKDNLTLWNGADDDRGEEDDIQVEDVQ
eukprot:TRINITY_DN93_c0_g3_i2.p1 TRINITY_DN93_c0_g3~~TRINITY_DN93_c0_g3_i2.p1  ORF type:complete len:300 (-),score=96.18 TRINITY_DN93_c0_g3_i2:242-1141(-)